MKKNNFIQALNTGIMCFASIVGAGFASGKELEVYFAHFGIWAFPTIIFTAILFYKFTHKFLKIGHEKQITSLSELNKIVWGKYTKLGNILFVVSNILLLSAMFAGADSIGIFLFPNLNYRFFSIISAIIAIIISSLNFKKMLKINSIIVPLLLVLVVLSLIFSLNFVEKINLTPTLPPIFSPFFAIIYLASNLYLVSFVFCKLGNTTTKSIHKSASLIFAILLSFFALQIVLILLINKTSSPMPLVNLLCSISPVIKYFACFVVWGGLLSTVVNILFSLSNWLNNYFKSPILSSSIICLFGLVLSGFGFSFIVNYFYPLIGIVGVIFIYLFIRKNKAN